MQPSEQPLPLPEVLPSSPGDTFHHQGRRCTPPCISGEGAGALTGVPEVNVVAIVGVLQLVGHDAEGHDLLSDEGVGPGDVHIHLRVVQLVG